MCGALSDFTTTMTENTSDDGNVSLAAYGVQHEPEISKRSTVTLGRRTVGGFGYDHSAGETVYYSEREAEEHRYHGADPWYDLPFDGDGYGLSYELFERISDRTGKVYIIETDTGDVLQFAFSQFVEGSAINVDGDGRANHPERGYEKDPQSVVPVDTAIEVYSGHASDVFVPQAAFR